MWKKIRRLFVIKTRFEALFVIYAIALGAVERGFHYVERYPGWGGLEVGSAMVRGVLDPVNPGYRRWDWKRNEPSAWQKVNAKRDLIIEGSGCLSRANRDLATFGIWIRLDPAERKRRAMARDGSSFDDHWDRWAVQEQAFFLRERPDVVADVILDARTDELIYRADPTPGE